MKAQIGKAVDEWLEEEDHQRKLALKIIRKNDPWYGMTEEEVEDRREFIRCYLLKDLEILLMIPIPPQDNDFWFSSHQEFMESAFNTHDFQETRKPFDKYGYRVKKIMDQVKELALLHSCISQPEGRANIQRRCENLVNDEFRNQLLFLVGRYQMAFDDEKRLELRGKIAKLNRLILECQTIWDRYSPWDT